MSTSTFGGGGKWSGFGTAYTCLSGVRPSVCLSVPAWVAAAKFAHSVRLAIGGGAYWAGRAAHFLALVGSLYLWPAHFFG